MGVPMPGYRPTILDPEGAEVEEGELALRLNPRPLGLMQGYQGDFGCTAQVMRDGVYRTGDVVRRDITGRYWYVGRADDVFKSSDYRISPFELESALIACDCVAEAAVVPGTGSDASQRAQGLCSAA
jgi:acetyl-CoA synthetase